MPLGREASFDNIDKIVEEIVSAPYTKTIRKEIRGAHGPVSKPTKSVTPVAGPSSSPLQSGGVNKQKAS